MKTRFLILLSIFSFQLAISQKYQTIEEVSDACSQLGFAGNEAAEIAVDAILDKMGLARNFVIQECPDINNAMAKNIDIGNGKKERYILYDSEFFKRIDSNAENDWAATSILAHEIGHHLNGHALNDEGSNHKWEIEADEFSGFVIAQMGGTIDDAQSAIKTLRYEKATRTHPAKADRLKAINIGFQRGLKQVSGNTAMIENVAEIEHIRREEEAIQMRIEYYKSYEPFLQGINTKKEKIVPYSIDDQWGYINAAGEFAVQPKYFHALDFSDGMALVQNKDLWYGYIDVNGNEVIKQQFTKATSFKDGLAVGCNGSACGLITKTGDKIAFNYNDIDSFSEGLCAVAKTKHGRPKKWGYINKKGEIVIPIKYFYVGRFRNGKATVDKGYHRYEIDKKGEILKKIF